jgi:hypothetical protein
VVALFGLQAGPQEDLPSSEAESAGALT